MLYTNLLFFDKEINLNPGIANIANQWITDNSLNCILHLVLISTLNKMINIIPAKHLH